ncbi:MAG: cytochrome d ubiquinol oxidase subunit II [Nitrospirota bacterium]|nr:cytochrome d ubiquinol oxidase subunit II [Nitrospirota bacterium]
METFWYAIVTLMLTMYVVLDGFDFGVGILYPFVTRTETERCTVLDSIGPVWKGNEVWLVASGGLLFFAFPRAYAAGFSGFYLALVMVLWLLIFRGLALELRSQLSHPLWRQLWDLAFSGASFFLAIVFGAALGNLIRGVPLNPEGYFFVALWTDFTPGPEPGILDWFTLLMGLASAAILMLHGANYLAMKTDGDLYLRAAASAKRTGWIAIVLTCIAMLASPFVQPALRLNYTAHPLGYLFTVTGALALIATVVFRRWQHDVAAFATSSLFILAMLGNVAWGCYPNLLIATTNPASSLTIFNATAGAYGLRVGLVWFLFGFALVITSQVYVHRAFWGKVRLDLESSPTGPHASPDSERGRLPFDINHPPR